MKRTCLLLLFLSVLMTVNYAQSSYNGVLVKSVYPHEKGEQIMVYASRINTVTNQKQYLIKGTTDFKFVNATKVDLNEEQFDFWERVWFEHRAADAFPNNWSQLERDALHTYENEFYKTAVEHDLLYTGEEVTDYLSDLLLDIHPTPIKRPYYIGPKVVVLKTHHTDAFALNNGLVVLTTGLLSQMETEEELKHILVECVAQTVLEHDLVNIVQTQKDIQLSSMFGQLAAIGGIAANTIRQSKGEFYNYDNALGFGEDIALLSNELLAASYDQASIEQQQLVINIAQEYKKTMQPTSTLSKEMFAKKMSNVLSYAAWDYYEVLNDKSANWIINRLLTANCATPKDYLLAAKLIKRNNNTTESTREALSLLTKGQLLDKRNRYIVFNREMGLLYIRLQDYTKAKACFLDYQKDIEALEAKGYNVDKELDFVDEMLMKY